MTKTFKTIYLRTLFFTLALLVIIIPAISSISFAQEEGVRAFINQVAQQLINTIKNPNVSLEKKRSKVKTIISENFDIAWMAQFAMGINYKKLSDSQREKYKSLYLNYLLNNYFPILIRYENDDSYEILRIQQIDTQDYDAKIKLVTDKTQNPIILKYRIRYKDTSYKCLDMVVEGVSTLISQRAEFASIIQQSGVNHLLERLESQQNKTN